VTQRLSSPPTDHLLVREIEARAARLAGDEFVEFSFAGAPAVGHFSCVVCGRNLTCVGLLPSVFGLRQPPLGGSGHEPVRRVGVPARVPGVSRRHNEPNAR
jgi:hypothetical protein